VVVLVMVFGHGPNKDMRELDPAITAAARPPVRPFNRSLQTARHAYGDAGLPGDGPIFDVPLQPSSLSFSRAGYSPSQEGERRNRRPQALCNGGITSAQICSLDH
jgi:hypothetical protein